MASAQAPTSTASKTDIWRDVPEKILVAMIDNGTDETHLLADKRVMKPITEEWLTEIGTEMLPLGSGKSSIHTPILVVRRIEDGEEGYWCVFGRRRVLGLRIVNERRAARGLKPLTLQYLLVKGDDQYLFGLMISENEHREEDDYANKAAKCHRFIHEFKATPKLAAQKFTCSEMQITHMLRFHAAPAEAQKAVGDGKLPASAVVAMMKEVKPEEFVPPPAPKLAAGETAPKRSPVMGTLTPAAADRIRAQLPERIAEFKAGTTTVKDVERQALNKKREAAGKEAVSPLPGRRIWGKLVELADSEKPPAAVRDLDELLVAMARVMAGTKNIKSVKGLSAALRAAGFETER